MSNKSLISLHGQPIGRKDFMQAVDQEIITLHDTSDINRVMTVLNGLDEVEGITGHAKAKLLYASNEWYKQNVQGENFGDHVASTTTLKKVTVDRYITVWRYVEDLTIPKEIAERPMRDLVPIAKTISQGYDISKAQWTKIKNTTNDGELRDVLRQIKGKAERKSAKVLRIERDGSLYLYIKGKPKKFIGFLNVKEAEQDVDIANAIEKIKISASISEE
jgi:DNA-binding TFAR19-related protein (PDSD5 family)